MQPIHFTVEKNASVRLAYVNLQIKNQIKLVEVISKLVSLNYLFPIYL